MIVLNNRRLFLILGLIISFGIFNQIYGQKSTRLKSISISKKNELVQDTALERRKRNAMTAAQPDTNFTWEKYAAFLRKVSDTSKYVVLPINEFRKTFNSNKIVVGLRHDVDNDLNVAFQFSETESKLGFRSTYYILHTAPYYLENPDNMALHSQKIIPILKTMQNVRKLEIGWHNDLVTLQLIYKLNPSLFLHDELDWLRRNGIYIFGTASHGSNYCKIYHYMNYYFFNDCTYPVVPGLDNNIKVPVDGVNIPIMKGNLCDFGLEYEAYFLNNNKYFSDATITNGIRWNIGMLDINQLQAGDRVIILLHPIHWHKASVNAKFESFRISGQKSSSIDTVNSVITVDMPYGTNLTTQIATFTLSPGAYAKVSGKLQLSGSTHNDFSDPLTYEVYSENRDIRKLWRIKIQFAKNSATDLYSFVIPGLTRSVYIDNTRKTILVKVNEGSDLRHLPVKFELSPGATACIGYDQQISNGSIHNFSNTIRFKVLAEDGTSSITWIITVQEVENGANFLVYPNPTGGLIHMQFRNMLTSPTVVEIFNMIGVKVYSYLVANTGDIAVEADMSDLPAGIYLLRYSKNEKPLKFIIEEH